MTSQLDPRARYLSDRKRMRGVTLLELIVIVMLILVIAVISIPRFIQVRQNAQLRPSEVSLNNWSMASSGQAMSCN
jgi:Tfp pilus assembly protein FimT